MRKLTQGRWLVVAALVAAMAQIAVLGWMIMGRAAILRDGTEVTLLTQPVDPRDLLRGDYVRITYNISTVPLELFTGALPQEGGPHPVEVRLRPGDDGIWKVVAAAFGELPGEPGADEVDMRGQSDASIRSAMVNVPVDFGIERYYLPEGTGRPIEEGIGERRFTMTVMVSDAGQAQIKALYDDGQLVFEEPLY